MGLYTEALSVDPDHSTLCAQLHCNRAAALGKLDRASDGIADCTRAIELDPNYVKAYSRRAQLRLQAEQFEDAVRDYEQAQRLDPDNAELARNLKHAQLELKKSKRKDYYKILEIPPDADDNQIKKAYRKMALKYHPDKNSETPEASKAAEEKFKLVAEAYQVLSDPKKRRRFDSGADLEEMGGLGGEGGVDVSDIFSMFFGGPGMGGGGGGHPFGGMGGSHPGFGGRPFGGAHAHSQFHQFDDDDDDDEDAPGGMPFGYRAHSFSSGSGPRQQQRGR